MDKLDSQTALLFMKMDRLAKRLKAIRMGKVKVDSGAFGAIYRNEVKMSDPVESIQKVKYVTKTSGNSVYLRNPGISANPKAPSDGAYDWELVNTCVAPGDGNMEVILVWTWKGVLKGSNAGPSDGSICRQYIESVIGRSI